MNRLGTIDPSAASGVVKQLFDGPLKGKHFNIFKSMAVSPATLQTYLAMSGALVQSGLSPAEREIIQLIVGEANRCGYCVAAHTGIGRAAGLTEQQTIEARRGSMGNPKYAALTRFTLALHEKRGHVTDADLQAFRAGGYTDAHAAEVIAVYALSVFTNYFNHVNDTPTDFPAAPAI